MHVVLYRNYKKDGIDHYVTLDNEKQDFHLMVPPSLVPLNTINLLDLGISRSYAYLTVAS